jgi:hypothetical protein
MGLPLSVNAAEIARSETTFDIAVIAVSSIRSRSAALNHDAVRTRYSLFFGVSQAICCARFSCATSDAAFFRRRRRMDFLSARTVFARAHLVLKMSFLRAFTHVLADLGSGGRRGLDQNGGYTRNPN